MKEALLRLLRPAGPLGPATVNKVHATGRRIVREAQLNEQWAGVNPFEVVRRLRQPACLFRTLSLAECRALLPHLRPDRRQEALLMLYLGLRPGCGHQHERREFEQLRCPTCDFKLMPVGIPLDTRFYDLRHSAATLHREAGADPLAIQLVLGHAPENLTDGIYTHLSIEYLRRELNKLTI